MNPLDDILPVANSFCNHIKFTLETSENDSLPFLDTVISYDATHTSCPFDSKLFIKKLHSGHILPWESHVPLQFKINLIKSERLRAIRNSNSTVSSFESLNLIKSRFISNGYPSSFVNRYLFNDPQRRRHSQSSHQPIFLRFPFINDRFANKVRRYLVRSNFPVKVIPIFISSPPLSILLQNRPKLVCPSNCLCAHRNLCLKKNIVYSIVCNLCNASYIGETHRTFFSRIKEHLSHSSGSLVFDHFKSAHNSSISIDLISTSILDSGFKDSLQRKAAERLFISSRRPSINVMFNRS